MTDASESRSSREQGRTLSDAVRDVKNALADRDDVVVDLGEAHRMRLELLAAELAPVFADVPTDAEMFDFALSSGLQPRLWIDAVSHVAMGRDRRTYRFLRDTRLGRVVLAESTDMKPVADQVTRYIAERMIERQRLMEGASLPPATMPQRPDAGEVLPAPKTGGHLSHGFWSAVASALGLVVAGALVGLGFSLVVFWDRVVAIVLSLRQ